MRNIFALILTFYFEIMIISEETGKITQETFCVPFPQVVTFYISKTKVRDGRWYDCLDLTGKLQKPPAFAASVLTCDAKVTRRDKALSDLETSVG